MSAPEHDVLGAPGDRTCIVMGILNVTTDSFSDGGRYAALDAAVAHGLQLAADGAAIVDVGGESTRPGADRVDVDEELRRVLPVVKALDSAGVRVSIDTTRAAVAHRALEAGAFLVNDVSGGLADPEMAGVVAGSGAGWILMHWRGPSKHMYQQAKYSDVVAEVISELAQRVEAAVGSGVDPDRLILDPGLGFAKQPQHDATLLARLSELTHLGLPVMVGASRKRFLGEILQGTDPDAGLRPVEGRDAATLTCTVIAAAAGAWGVRVHDARGSVDALRVVQAVRNAGHTC